MNHTFLKQAIDEAERSDFHYKVGAVIYNKKSLISLGHNYAYRSIKSHNPIFRKTPFSIHAEVDAIIKARRPVKGYSILVVRINNKKELKLSKPCKYCLAYLQHVGISKIFYSLSYYPYIERLNYS